MVYASKIKSCYPYIYKMIISTLMKLDKSENLKDTFPNIDIKFINKIRDSILNEKVEITRELYLRAYAEAGLYKRKY